MKIRHPMGLRHSVDATVNRVIFMNESCHTYESVIVTHIIGEY